MYYYLEGVSFGLVVSRDDILNLGLQQLPVPLVHDGVLLLRSQLVR